MVIIRVCMHERVCALGCDDSFKASEKLFHKKINTVWTKKIY